MRNISVLLSVLMLLPGLASADSLVRGSEASVAGVGSLVIGSGLILSSPFLVVKDVLASAADSSKVTVTVTTEKGATETIALSKDTVTKANLKAGDKLTVKPTAAGAVLSKDEAVLVFVAKPGNTKLSRSHDLAR